MVRGREVGQKEGKHERGKEGRMEGRKNRREEGRRGGRKWHYVNVRIHYVIGCERIE